MRAAPARTAGDYAPGMFRTARPDDFPQLIRLYRQLNPDDPHLSDGSDERAFARILATEGLHLFVLDLDGTVVATSARAPVRCRWTCS